MIKKLVSVSLLVAAVLVLAPVDAGAQQAKALPLQSHAFGRTLGEWSAEWWQQMLETPGAQNPLALEGENARCDLGAGRVAFLASTLDGSRATRTCSVSPGTALLVPLLNAECSQAEGNGDTEEDLSACAAELMEHFTSVSITVNGMPVRGLQVQRVQSPLFSFRLPEDNVLGLAASVAPSLSVADGVYVLLAPLPVGTHTIEFGGVATFGSFVFAPGARYTLHVVP